MTAYYKNINRLVGSTHASTATAAQAAIAHATAANGGTRATHASPLQSSQPTAAGAQCPSTADLACTSTRQLPKRKITRAEWCDYNAGLYFITFVVKDRKQLLVHITDENNIHLTLQGEIVKYVVGQLNRHLPWCSVMNYTIMPNHVHAIIHIDNATAPHNNRQALQIDDLVQLVKNNEKLVATEQRGLLSHVVGTIKSNTTRIIRNKGVDIEWQRGFHDHIIRNHDDWHKIECYINDNIYNWHNDRYNPTQPSVCQPSVCQPSHVPGAQCPTFQPTCVPAEAPVGSTHASTATMAQATEAQGGTITAAQGGTRATHASPLQSSPGENPVGSTHASTATMAQATAAQATEAQGGTITAAQGGTRATHASTATAAQGAMAQGGTGRHPGDACVAPTLYK